MPNHMRLALPPTPRTALRRPVSARLLLGCVWVALSACQGPSTAPASGERAETSAPPAARPVAPPARAARAVTATDVDPGAMDEALRAALRDLRDRFRCNSISGCKAHDVLVGFGYRARRPLEAIFPTAPQQAPYRSRIVRIVAELQDPASRPFLRSVLQDGSDKARGYAVYGLALLGDPRDQEMMRSYAEAPGIIASAMTRVSAAWGLAYQGEASGAARFDAVLREAAVHQLGGVTLRWALELCRVPKGPRCDTALALSARHPAYVVRREVLRTIGPRPQRAHAAALVVLAADPNPNLARRARRALQTLSGRVDIRDAAGWRAWHAAQQGAAPAPGHASR